MKTITLRENNLQQIQNSLSCLFKVINDKQIYDSFSKEVENCFKDIPQSTVFTEEMASKLTRECTYKIVALLHEKGFFNQE
ncbi:hypothetical protein OGM63_11370 [Plectonema radiosum NIES-515]|uniref:Uncharacterized protein n=1 Tax=Plectonema radiosum NIES-515 TaxID=2986073 RepID=A0ABT3AY93_9CYAN|nr:hypothetical protein [Plectonema radiosum]MCV3214102.1 hypothetical protein [Plectonema radiosum NIES-515]